MTARRTALRTGLGALACALVLVACGGGDSSPTASKRGTALLADAKSSGASSDAVSFEQQTTGSGRALEQYARRGDDSLVVTEYDDGGNNEVRRVDGVVYVRADLRLTTGQAPIWIRLEPGADLPTWITLLGDDLLAPTPKAVSDLLTARVDVVTDVVPDGSTQRLTVEPKPVRNGERPSSITVTKAGPELAGRSAQILVNEKVLAQRTYSKVLWGAAATPILAPEGAVTVEGVRDPQAAALPAAILRGPAALPAGWGLRAVIGITPAQGDATCQQVLTLYAAEGQPVSSGYLAVYLKPSGCATPRAAGAADFVAGTNRGWIGEDAGVRVGAVTVDGVSVRFRSTLPAAELATVLASWRPLPA